MMRYFPRFEFISILLIIIGEMGLVGCHSQPTVTGYWEGKGKASETLMSDGFKELTRSADFEFWFMLNEDGIAVGEMDIVYDALLKIENLPKITAPVPGGNITFAPKVGGKITDLDPSRHFQIVGLLKGDELTLEIAVEEKERKSLEFTLRADPGVSAGFDVGGFGKKKGQDVGKGSIGISSGGLGAIIHKIPMTPFSPFGSAAKVEKRPGGPFAARVNIKSKKYSIDWTARQMGGEQREVVMSPVIEKALERLRQK